MCRDVAGNCQAAFTVVPVQTKDVVPPVLSPSVSVPPKPEGGNSAVLHVQLDEPGTAYWLLMEANGPTYPTAEQVRCSGRGPRRTQTLADLSIIFGFVHVSQGLHGLELL